MPPGRAANQPAAPAVSEPYEKLPGLLQCSRCGSVVADSDQARRAHDALHVGLRRLWKAIEDRAGGRP